MKKPTRELLKKAWIAGVKAQRKKYLKIEEIQEPPYHWRKPEDFKFEGSEYEAGMLAAAKVLLSGMSR